MKDFFEPFSEGFLGSFTLAGAIVAAVISGIWLGISTVFSAFMKHQPMPTSLRKALKSA